MGLQFVKFEPVLAVRFADATRPLRQTFSEGLGPNRALHLCGCVLITAFLVALPNPSLANWWIVRSSDKQCLVVDIEPTGKDKSVTKIGKEVYLTREEAEAEAKQLCKQ